MRPHYGVVTPKIRLANSNRLHETYGTLPEGSGGMFARFHSKLAAGLHLSAIVVRAFACSGTMAAMHRTRRVAPNQGSLTICPT
jgi:hypothetical protein